jgi:hypothetical protein
MSVTLGRGERGEPIAGEERAAAAKRRLRRDLGEQLGRERRGERRAPAVKEAQQRRRGATAGAREADREADVAAEIGDEAHELQRAGREAKQGAKPLWNDVIVLGQNPRRRALKDIDVFGTIDNRRHNLNRTGASADDGDALSGDVRLARTPIGRVNERTIETIQIGNLGPERLGQLTDTRNDESTGNDAVGVVGVVAQRGAPERCALIPARGNNSSAKSNHTALIETKLTRRVLKIGQQLGLTRPLPRPVRIRRKRV